MSYQDFLEELLCELNSRGYGEYKFELNKATRTNNNAVDAIIVRYEENSMVAPQIYISNFYKQYEEYGRDVVDIADEMMDIAEKEKSNLKHMQDFIGELRPVNAREHLTLRLYNKEWNPEIEKTCAYMDVEGGMMAVPRWNVESDQEGMEASFLVTHNLQRRLLMTDEEVLGIAYENSMNQEYHLQGMSEVIHELTGQDVSENMGEETMYVLTNQKKSFGAIAIMNKDVLRDVQKQLGEDEFFVLPSSVHECLIVPASQVESPEFLQATVKEVNETQVDLEERLGEDVLRFNGKKLQVCNSMEEAMKQRKEEVEVMKHEEKHEKMQRRTA